MKRERSLLLIKSEAFAGRVVKMYQYLTDQKKELIISKQILRSGTSIGANIYEANYAQSNSDFVHKMEIALYQQTIRGRMPAYHAPQGAYHASTDDR